MTQKVVKYKILDYSKFTDDQLNSKFEQYIGKMQIIRLSGKPDMGTIRDVFGCTLNIYNLLIEIDKRDSFNDLDTSGLIDNINLN